MSAEQTNIPGEQGNEQEADVVGDVKRVISAKDWGLLECHDPLTLIVAHKGRG